MHRFVVMAALCVACGSDDAPTGTGSESASGSGGRASGTATVVPATTTAPAPEAADPALCDRVRPCAVAFIAIAPATLAAPAQIAVEQLDHSLVESPARAAACRDAIASFRADLERLELEVPEACR